VVIAICIVKRCCHLPTVQRAVARWQSTTWTCPTLLGCMICGC